MQVYPASTTKIMTCVLALENSDLSETVTLGEEIKQISGDSSTADLIVGEEMSMEDMLYGLMLSSGNDAANAIAVHVAGSIEAFVGMMNQKAAELGMNGTHYANAHGLHAEDHYTTLADMQLLLMHAYQNETFRTIVSTYEHTVAPTNKAPEGHAIKTATACSTHRRPIPIISTRPASRPDSQTPRGIASSPRRKKTACASAR